MIYANHIAGRSKLNLFGVGVYLSALPGVSLMYGPALLLCKVLPGRAETFRPDGTLPPDIPPEYDSRLGLLRFCETLCEALFAALRRSHHILQSIVVCVGMLSETGPRL